VAQLKRLPAKYGKDKSDIWYVRIWLPEFNRYKFISTGERDERKAKWYLTQVKKAQFLVRARIERDINKALKQVDLGGEIIKKDLSILTLSKRFIKSVSLRVAKQTVRSYSSSVDNLMDAFRPTMSILELNPDSYDKLVTHLRDIGLTDTTINIRLRSIKVFFNWCIKRRIIDVMPFHVQLLKIGHRSPKLMDRSELDAILNNIDDIPSKQAINVYLHTGLRKSELSPKNHVLEGNGRYLKVIDKGNKKRIVPMPENVLNDYQSFMESGRDVNKVSRLFSKAREKSGIKDPQKTLHALRHTFAFRKLYETKMDIIQVRDIMGHTSVKVTEGYSRVGLDYLESIFGKNNDTKYANA